jgi:hypothetical protein
MEKAHAAAVSVGLKNKLDAGMTGSRHPTGGSFSSPPLKHLKLLRDD